MSSAYSARQAAPLTRRSTRNRRPARRYILAAALGLILAACGSGDESATDSSAVTVAPASDTEEGTAATESEDDHGGEDDHGDEDHDDHDESGGLGAHEHGSAELSVAWIDGDVVVDLISPTQNVFGFEYEPESEEDLAIEADRTEALTAPGIVALNEAAGCELTEPASAETERDGSHSEITVSWSFACENASEIASLDLGPLFAAFPGFEDIDAEWVSATEQSSAELSPQQPTLRFES